MTPWNELLRLAADGDEEARARLLREIYPKVEAQVHRNLDRDFRRRHPWMLQMFSTGDIVQEVFLAVVKSRPEAGARNEFELQAWLASQVQNRIVDRVRFHLAQRRNAQRARPLATDAGDAVAGRDPTPSVVAALDERARILEVALAELDERQRCLWQLRMVEECEFGDIARRLDLASEEAARSAFRRLQAKLAVRLHRLGVQSHGDIPPS
ncbi:MAG: sigma-70 family RNA polymerase sigma factor [Planctomycetota bacterium]